MTHYTARKKSQLEALWQQPAVNFTTAAPASTAASFRQFAKDLLAFFTGTQQLRIWTKSTKQGVTWFAYDPASNQRIGHASEAALRVWLESRHQR